MVDVRRNDGASARHLGAHEFRRQSLTGRDELHFWGDLAATRVIELRADVTSRPARCDPRRAEFRETVAHIVSLWTAGVIKADRRLATAQRHLPHRHFEGYGIPASRQRGRARFDDLARVRIGRGEVDHELLPSDES